MDKITIECTHPEIGKIVFDEKQEDKIFDKGNLKMSIVKFTITDIHGQIKVIERLMSDDQFIKIIEELGPAY